MATFGNTDFAGSTTTWQAIDDPPVGQCENVILSAQFNLSEDGTASSVTVKIKNTSSTKSFKCLIYRLSDLALIAETETRSIGVVTGTTEVFNFKSTVNLPATDYLLCVWSSAGTGGSGGYWKTTGGTSNKMTIVWSSTSPNPFVKDGVNDVLQFAIYCTYTAGLTKLIGHTLFEGGGTLGVEDVITGGRFTMPAEVGTAVSITARLVMSGAPADLQAKCLIYRMSDFVLMGQTEELTFTTNVSEWQVFDVIVPFTLAASTEYIICLWTENDATNVISLAFRTTGGSGSERDAATYGVAPDPIVPTVHSTDDLLCIYCIYSVGTLIPVGLDGGMLDHKGGMRG